MLKMKRFYLIAGIVSFLNSSYLLAAPSQSASGASKSAAGQGCYPMSVPLQDFCFYQYMVMNYRIPQVFPHPITNKPTRYPKLEPVKNNSFGACSEGLPEDLTQMSISSQLSAPQSGNDPMSVAVNVRTDFEGQTTPDVPYEEERVVRYGTQAALGNAYHYNLLSPPTTTTGVRYCPAHCTQVVTPAITITDARVYTLGSEGDATLPLGNDNALIQDYFVYIEGKTVLSVSCIGEGQ